MKAAPALWCVILVLLTGCVRPDQPIASTPYPVGIGFYPEMTFVPEVDEWPAVKSDLDRAEMKKVAAAWAITYPWVETQISPTRVRGLSRWSVAQMANYSAVASLSGAAFQPVAAKDRALILESTVETLPSHSTLVHRWLKLFIVYDLDRAVILRVAVTIRGEVQE